MTPSYPVVSGQEVTKALRKADFLQVSQRGSHVKLKHEDGRIVIVPMHKELAIGTFKSILKQAQIDLDTFWNLLG